MSGWLKLLIPTLRRDSEEGRLKSQSQVDKYDKFKANRVTSVTPSARGGSPCPRGPDREAPVKSLQGHHVWELSFRHLAPALFPGYSAEEVSLPRSHLRSRGDLLSLLAKSLLLLVAEFSHTDTTYGSADFFFTGTARN